MSKSRSNKAILDWYAHRLQQHYARNYQALLEGEEGEGEQHELSTPPDLVPHDEYDQLPESVRASQAYYSQHFEQTDLGCARVYRVRAGSKPTFAIRVKTDGDDGFLEVYDEKGGFLAAGRTYLELIQWGTQQWLRAQAATPGDLPPELQQITWTTLWGKPAEGYHCMETCAHECRASPAGRCNRLQNHHADGSAHQCAVCFHEWGGVEPVPPTLVAPAPDGAEPWAVKIHQTDGRVFGRLLGVTEIPLVTAKGRRVVPVAEVRRIEFAARAEGESDLIHLDDERITGRIEGEAFAVRDPGVDPVELLSALRYLEPTLPDLTAYGGQFGRQLQFTIFGHNDGGVYGTNTYTLDSCLATAAVHAGVLKNNKLGVVRVEIVPSPASFEASKKKGITTWSWDGAMPEGAFRFLDPKDKG